MSKRKKCLLTDPEDHIKFSPPFTLQSVADLKVTNAYDFPVSFKVQTTKPERYCVRPKGGTLDPAESVGIKISLRKPGLDALEGTNSKFRILAFNAPPVESGYSVTSWLNEHKPDVISEVKIKCIFDSEEGTGGKENAFAPDITAEEDEVKFVEAWKVEKAEEGSGLFVQDEKGKCDSLEHIEEAAGNIRVVNSVEPSIGHQKIGGTSSEILGVRRCNYRVYGFLLVAAVVAASGVVVTNFYL